MVKTEVFFFFPIKKNNFGLILVPKFPPVLAGDFR